MNNKHSIELLLWEYDGEPKDLHPIYLKISINGDRKYLSTGYEIHHKYWNETAEEVKPGHPNAKSINTDISNLKQKVIAYVIRKNVEGVRTTAAEVKRLFSSKGNQANIFDFVEAFSKEVKHKREGSTLENYRKHLKKLETYHGSRLLTFEEITHDYLVDYENWLRSHKEDDEVHELNENYIHAIWKTLKTFFNAARKRKITTNYPFETYENPIYKPPRKDYLTLKELDKVEKLADTTADPVIKQAAVYFLLGCYTGLRISDWFKFNTAEHVNEGRIFLHPKKGSKKSSEWVTMPVVGRLKDHMPRIRRIALQIEEQTINKTLKEIATRIGSSKRITSHSARHTFAITMCAEKGMGVETCAELMGITVKTCMENYYQVTPQKIYDEAIKAWSS